MFYALTLTDTVRVPPHLFSEDVQEAVRQAIREKYEGHVSKELGIVIDVMDVEEPDEGVVVPDDGAAYYQLSFTLLTYKPQVGELTYGRVKDIADFGAFMDIGVIDGMIHISQTMDDFVTFNPKEKVLSGRQTKKVLKIGDLCRARIVAVSFKDPANPKIGLTMRQPGLGKLEWLAQRDEKGKKKGMS